MRKLGEMDSIQDSPAWLSLQMKLNRMVLGLSQNDLAELADVSPQTIKKMEMQGANPRYGTLQKVTSIFKAFGLESTKTDGGISLELDDALQQVIADNRLKQYIEAKVGQGDIK